MSCFRGSPLSEGGSWREWGVMVWTPWTGGWPVSPTAPLAWISLPWSSIPGKPQGEIVHTRTHRDTRTDRDTNTHTHKRQYILIWQRGQHWKERIGSIPSWRSAPTAPSLETLGLGKWSPTQGLEEEEEEVELERGREAKEKGGEEIRFSAAAGCWLSLTLSLSPPPSLFVSLG